MPLSSNTLIHFTRSKSNIIGILRENFKLKYCRESISSRTESMDLLIPMVSFCDIPLSQVLVHSGKYGCYGIGLKKSWAEKNGLNPVLYIDRQSEIGHHLLKHINKLIKNGDNKISNFTLEQKYGYDILRYLKNYEGKLIRLGKPAVDCYRFSDEREWRYVLNLSSQHRMFSYIPKIRRENELFLKSAKEQENNKISDERLCFEPDDINYIIIKEESERDNIIEELGKIKAKYPFEQVNRLRSRILSIAQIRSDF